MSAWPRNSSGELSALTVHGNSYYLCFESYLIQSYEERRTGFTKVAVFRSLRKWDWSARSFLQWTFTFTFITLCTPPVWTADKNNTQSRHSKFCSESKVRQIQSASSISWTVCEHTFGLFFLSTWTLVTWRFTIAFKILHWAEYLALVVQRSLCDFLWISLCVSNVVNFRKPSLCRPSMKSLGW